MPPDKQIITLESIDMTTGNYRFWCPKLHGSAKVDIVTKKFARRDGGVAVHKKTGSRRMDYVGYVFGNDRWHAMLLVDNLKRFIKRNQVEIGAQFPEGFRYWRAHLLEPIPKTTSTSIDRIPMTLPFLVPEGYGFSNIDQELFTPKTNLSGGQLIAVNAFTNYQVLPVITITINSVTPNTPITLNISNATLYSHLEINTPLSAGDVLVLDSFDERATLNGNVVDAPGLFPFFTEPSEELSIQTDAASINFDINSTYRSLWL